MTRRIRPWAVIAAFISAVFLLPAPLSFSTVQPPEWVGVYNVKEAAGLLWIKTPGVARYKVYRRRSDENIFRELGQTSTNRFTDRSVKPGETYYYRLIGVTENGRDTSASAEISFTVEAKAKKIIRPPVWEGHIFAEEGVGLKWSSPDHSDVVTYNIYRTLLPRGKEELLASTREKSYTDRSVEDGRQYRYRITALDGSFKETEPSGYLVVTFERKGAMEDLAEKASSWNPRKSYLISYIYGGKNIPFRSPTDVALSDDGLLFVADSGNGLIQVFTRDGQFRYNFPVAPGGRETASYPLGLTIGGDGRIYCTDARSGRILVYRPTGILTDVTNLMDAGGEKETGLLDLCLDKDENLYVIDNLNHRVVQFDSKIRFVRYIGEPGLGPGQMTYPAFCIVDAEGRFMVSESLGGRLQFYDSEGQFIKSFGRYGGVVGALARPKGIAVDSRGRIYVADSWLCRIQAFDEMGRFLFTLADEKSRPLDLGSPNGIYIDGEDNIYIAERLAHRVQIRRIQND